MNATKAQIDTQVENLRAEAAIAGDLAMVDTCERALGGEEVAYAKCVKVIAAAAAEHLGAALAAYVEYDEDDTGPEATAAWRSVQAAARAAPNDVAAKLLARHGYDFDLVDG